MLGSIISNLRLDFFGLLAGDVCWFCCLAILRKYFTDIFTIKFWRGICRAHDCILLLQFRSTHARHIPNMVQREACAGPFAKTLFVRHLTKTNSFLHRFEVTSVNFLLPAGFLNLNIVAPKKMKTYFTAVLERVFFFFSGAASFLFSYHYPHHFPVYHSYVTPIALI